MMPLRSAWRWLAIASLLSVPACLSSAAPAPPVRWFDPVSPLSAGDLQPAITSQPRFRVVVSGAPYLRQEFALRVGMHEIVYDADHRWVADPVLLVRRALLQKSGGDDPSKPVVEVFVETFELDLHNSLSARVQLRIVRPDTRPNRLAEGSAEARSNSPEDLAAAMTSALAAAVAGVTERVAAHVLEQEQK